MEIHVDNVFSKITGYYPEKLVQDATSYFQHGAWFAPSYKKGFWDGRIRFAKKDREKNLIIPTGFLSKITNLLDKDEWPYSLYDNREIISPDPIYELNDNERGKIALNEGRFSYQGFAVDRALSLGRGIIKMATGSGKTEIGAAIIKSLLPQLREQGKGVLWLTHRGQLAQQSQERLQERLEQDVALFGYGKWKTNDVTVLMVQSAREYGKDNYPILTKLIDNCGLVIGDEVHHLEGDEWYTTFKRIPAAWRFGLTATPRLTGPGMALQAMTEGIIVDIGVWDLINRLVLATPRIWWIEVEEPELDKKLKWQSVYSQGIVYNQFRNTWIKFVADTFKNEGKSCLTLVQRINHGEMLSEILNAEKIRTVFLSGKDSYEYRKKVMNQLKEGELHHVIGQVTAGFGEGADFPWLRAIINATGSSGGGDASEDDEAGRVTKQILGRGLRRYKGKTYIEYVDFIDKGHKALRKASSHRYGTLVAEGYDVVMERWIRRESN